MRDPLEVWKELRPLVTEGTHEQQIETTVSIFLNKMNQENKITKPAEFDLKPTLIKVISFDRVKGSKFVDKFGFTNVLKFSVEGVEHTFDITSYSFFVAVRDAKLAAGDLAMMLTFGFNASDKTYRFWNFQKTGVVALEGKAVEPTHDPIIDPIKTGKLDW